MKLGKERGILLLAAGLVVLIIILAQMGLLPFFAVYQTPVFCNGYSWISCVAKDATPAAISEKQDVDWLGNVVPEKKSCLHYQCRLTGFNPSSAFVDMSAVKLFVDGQSYYLDQLPVTIARGQTFSFGYTTINSLDGTFFYVPINEVLLWTGAAGSTVGTPVLGADGCTFNPGQHDKVLLLFNQFDNEVEVDKIYTVPTGYAYSYVDSEKRHICGYLEEACTGDSDCIGHPLTWDIAGDSECSNGYLNRYGCRQYSEQCVEWDTDNKERCLERKTLSRCEVVERRAVQCCPYTDSCGEGVCDPETFTCQMPPEVECTFDWECGQAQYCDRELKQILAKKCVGNSCETQVIQSVECCYDMDCPLNYYCSAQYTCLPSAPPTAECPYACCVNEQGFFDKPAPPGKVCCPDHTIADSLDKCGTTPGDPNKDKDACISRPGDGLFILGYDWVEEGAFEIWGMKFFTTTKCLPIWNVPLLLVVIFAIVGSVTVGGILIWRKYK